MKDTENEHDISLINKGGEFTWASRYPWGSCNRWGSRRGGCRCCNEAKEAPPEKKVTLQYFGHDVKMLISALGAIGSRIFPSEKEHVGLIVERSQLSAN